MTNSSICPRMSEIVSPIVGGAAISIVELLTCGHPLDRIKIYQQANLVSQNMLKSTHNIYLHEGLRGFYSGLRWSILKSPGKAAMRWLMVSRIDDFYKQILPSSMNHLLPLMVGVTAAGFESLLVICPAESLKTKEMTYKGKFPLLKFVQKEGIRSIYEGANAVIVRQVMSWCSYLVALNAIKQCMIASRGNNELSLQDKLAITMSAGGVNVLCTAPFDMAKTKLQQIDPLKQKKLLTVFQALFQMHGIKGVYRGVGASLLRSCWHASVTVVLADRLELENSMIA